jgi:hypothetical protein
MGLQQIPSKGGIPSGNTASRPGSPVIGDTFYNGQSGQLEIYNGTNWIPTSAPAAQPTIVVSDVGTSIAYGSAQASVAFTEGTAGGVANGFSAFTISGTSYTNTSTSSPIIVTLGNNGSYTFGGTAYNSYGVSPQSAGVTQAITTVPQAPTIGTATASSSVTEVTVTWTLGNNGGKNLSAITITPYLNGTTAETSRTAATTSSTSYTFTSGQLTANSSYTFKVKATNANGVSLESAASNSATPLVFLSVDYLVVAGGGGGGGPHDFSTKGTGGGGGAGGLRSTVTATGGGGTLESALTLSIGTNYTVTVGAGGAGGKYRGTSGSNSIFSSITSTGGGGAGSAGGGERSGLNGGSGGGGGAWDGNRDDGGLGTANQGYNGGPGNQYYFSGAGGGGGASVNGNFVDAGGTGGPGGNGVATSITGTSTTYAGGGGGGGSTSTAGTGGSGGGGVGASGNGSAAGTGTANTGGGGGGGAVAASNYNGVAGGSGVVILRWLTSAGSITVGAGLTADTTGTTGSYSYKRITAGSGNVSFA